MGDLRGLTAMQEIALTILAFANTQNNGPACASDIRCHQVWYVGDVMSLLAKRGYVYVEGKGSASLYTITDKGRAILRALEAEGKA